MCKGRGVWIVVFTKCIGVELRFRFGDFGGGRNDVSK